MARHSLNKWSEKHAAKIWRRIELHLVPKLGAMPIQTIKPMDVLNLIRAIEKKGTTEISQRILQICTAIFRYGIVTGRVSYNPAADLKGALVSMIVACEIRENLFLYTIAREQEIEEGLIFLQRVSNLKEAWKQFVLNYGIREESIPQLSPPESSYMCLVEGRLPQPNPEAIKYYQLLWHCR